MHFTSFSHRDKYSQVAVQLIVYLHVAKGHICYRLIVKIINHEASSDARLRRLQSMHLRVLAFFTKAGRHTFLSSQRYVHVQAPLRRQLPSVPSLSVV